MATYQSGPCIDNTPHQREGEIHSKSTILRVAAVENPVIIRTNVRLDDENWIDWSEHMILILAFCGVDGYTKGEIAQPNSDDDPEGAKNWAFNDTYAKLLIRINLSSTQVVHTMGCKTAHNMWANLEAVHEPLDKRVILYSREVFCTMADEETNIPEHLNKLKRRREWVNRVKDYKISDVMFKRTIVTSLPPSWKDFTDFLTGGANSKSWEHTSAQELIGIIRQEHFYRCRRQESNEQKTDVFCHHCKRRNHSTEQCYHLTSTKCDTCGRFGHDDSDCWSGPGRNRKRRKIERA